MTLIRVNELGPSDRKHDLKRFWLEVAPVIQSAVVLSFEEAHMLHPTRAEVVDRCDQAKELVKVMRFDFKWSKQRIRSELLPALRARLLGLKDDLEQRNARQTWGVDGDRGVSMRVDPIDLAPEAGLPSTVLDSE